MTRISVTGDGKGTSRGGFTLLEILLVLLMIVTLTGLFVASIDVVFRDQDQVTVEDAFWEAARDARLQALYSRRPASLFFDQEEHAFMLYQGEEQLATYPVSRTRDGDSFRVEFVQERASTEFVLIRGELVDTRPIGEAVFYPDGTCTSFWVQVNAGSENWHIRIDPWTGAELLSVND